MSIPLIFAATSDLAGKVRGKAFPAEQLDRRLKRGVGWTPTNTQITCFDIIAETPFGALGDLLLIPDARAGAAVAVGDTREQFMLGDITNLDGTPWELCTRSILKAALARLQDVSGAQLFSAFEHEFQIKDTPIRINQAYGREGFDLHRQLCETLMGALADNGIGPDSIMKEYGPNQYEVVIDATHGVGSADHAVILRELTRSIARAMGETATFTPIRDVASVGNGVHIHMSLQDADGNPLSYDENGPQGLSPLMGAFAGGVLKYLPSILALTAPSVISYERLTPHRWSAPFNNLGFRDREAALRICPVTEMEPSSIARQYNLEFRACDAAATPHLALAAIVHAGAQGIEDGLAPPDATHEDLSLLSADDLAARGFERLPTSLESALANFGSDPAMVDWFGQTFVDVYCAHKTAEIAALGDMDVAQKCAMYEETY